MPNEREHQTEVLNMINKFGWGVKMQSDLIICPRCHAKVHPVHKGMSDYHGDIRAKRGKPVSVKIEMKANLTRYTFDQLEPEQLEFMEMWQKETKGIAYLWLQLGSYKAGSNHPFARSAWLIPINDFKYYLKLVEVTGGVKYIPMNRDDAEGGRIKDKSLNAKEMFAEYELEWLGNGLFIPNKNHSWYKFAKDSYDAVISKEVV